jgi:CHRD domain-containing protein
VDDIMSITMAHIHRAPPDENGPVVHWLYDGSVPFDPAHPVSGTIPFSPTSVLDMIEGTYYVNVHTEDHPGGEIRGQVSDFAPPETLTVPLSGQQEVPPRETDASGVAKLTLDPLINRLFYQVEVSDIMSITMSHFHEGMAGTNGPVRHWLFPHAPDRPGTIDNNAFAPGEPIGGGIYLDGDSLLDLLTNFYYVNVHTERYPPGELRGHQPANHRRDTCRAHPPAHLGGAWPDRPSRGWAGAGPAATLTPTSTTPAQANERGGPPGSPLSSLYAMPFKQSSAP